MRNSNDKKSEIERILQIEYQKKGFLLEDDIIDICIEHDLDLVDIDDMCDKLFNQGMIVRDGDDRVGMSEDSFIDRSHLDYDLLLNDIKREYPNCTYLIDEILKILPPQSKEWQTIIREAKSGNAYARERIILMYLRTVMKLAYNYSNANYCNFEDAFQDGVLGLMKAIDKFDITSPDNFPSYFSLWVMQSMQRYAMIKGTIMRYPTHYQEQFIGIINSACEIMENDNFEEAIEWVTQEDFESENFVNMIAIEHILPYVPIPEELEAEDVMGGILQDSLKEVLDKMLSNLKEKERHILELRNGLKDGREQTLEEVGTIFNVSRERIRQIESKALEKLRSSSNSVHAKDYL